LPLVSDEQGQVGLPRAESAAGVTVARAHPTRTELAERHRYDSRYVSGSTTAVTAIAGTDQYLHDHHLVHDHEH
jgi:hypothetical protein